MKKIFAVVAALTLVSAGATAQNRLSSVAFAQNDLMWNLGYGLVGGVFDNSHNIYRNCVNPISVSAEYGVVGFGKFTLGVGAYVSCNWAQIGSENVGYNRFSIVAAVRPALHFSPIGILDISVGANIGYNIMAARKYGNLPLADQDPDSEFAWAPYIGARFMITPSFGIFGEAGFGNIAKEQNGSGSDTNTEATFVNVGLSFNF